MGMLRGMWPLLAILCHPVPTLAPDQVLNDHPDFEAEMEK